MTRLVTLPPMEGGLCTSTIVGKMVVSTPDQQWMMGGPSLMVIQLIQFCQGHPPFLSINQGAQLIKKVLCMGRPIRIPPNHIRLTFTTWKSYSWSLESQSKPGINMVGPEPCKVKQIPGSLHLFLRTVGIVTQLVVCATKMGGGGTGLVTIYSIYTKTTMAS